MSKSLEQLLQKEFRAGVAHWCDGCHSTQKIESSYVKVDYVVVQYKCKDVRIYEIKHQMLKATTKEKRE